jgi:hypothetical protein
VELREKSESDQHDSSISRIAVVPIGSIALRTYFEQLGWHIEPSSQLARHLQGQGFDPFEFGVPDMPKAARISVPIPASTVASEKSESHPLVAIAIFSGIGLLVSLIAIIMGVQGAWY